MDFSNLGYVNYFFIEYCGEFVLIVFIRGGLGIWGQVIWICNSGLCWPLRTFIIIKFKIKIIYFVTIIILLRGRIPKMLELFVCFTTFIICQAFFITECASSRRIFGFSTIGSRVIITLSDSFWWVCALFSLVVVVLAISILLYPLVCRVLPHWFWYEVEMLN